MTDEEKFEFDLAGYLVLKHTRASSTEAGLEADQSPSSPRSLARRSATGMCAISNFIPSGPRK